MLELYSLLSPFAILFFIILSILGLIIQVLYFSIITGNRKKKFFEFLIASHLTFISLIFRKLSSNISQSIILLEMYTPIRSMIIILIVTLGIYILTKEKSYNIFLAIFLSSITSHTVEKLPYGVYTFCFIISIIGLMVRAGVLYIMELENRKIKITEHSIKEALDTQHSGILFADKKGSILLVNKQMLYLMKKLTGKNHRNAKKFWDSINILSQSIHKINIYENGPDNLICGSDNDSWQFLKKEITYKGKKIYQITATDVTLQETINKVLKNYGRQLEEQQKELHIALRNLEQLAKEEAVSRSWDYIHGVLGQYISILQRIIIQENPLRTDEIFSLIKELQEDLISINEKSPQNIYDELLLSFTSLGVNLHKEGNLPENHEVASLFVEIIREGTTNALRHSQANNIYVGLSENKSYTLTLTNDGILAEENIVWGGGLHSINSKVKDLYGEFTVNTRPRFSLYVEIPK